MNHESTKSTIASKKIAIIGGGPSGIYASYLLRDKFPNASIHLYEKETNLGGNAKAVKLQNGEAELCLKLLPSCTLMNDSLYFHEKFQNLLLKYSDLKMVNNVSFIDRKFKLHDSNKTTSEKIKTILQMMKGFDILYPLSKCRTAAEVLKLNIFNPSESLIEFGKRTGLDLFCQWQLSTLDILGFDAGKLEAPAYMALYQRSFYSTGFYQKIFLENKKINKLAKLLVSKNIIKIKHKNEFLQFLNRQPNGSVYTTTSKSINTILCEIAQDNINQINLNAEIENLVSLPDGSASFSYNGNTLQYDLVFVCIPSQKLAEITEEKTLHNLYLKNLKKKGRSIAIFAYQADDLLGVTQKTSTGLIFDYHNLGGFGLGPADVGCKLVTGICCEKDIVSTLSYEEEVDIQKIDEKHRRELLRFGFNPVKLVSTGIFNYHAIAGGGINQDLLDTHYKNNHIFKGIRVSNESLHGAGMIASFRHLEFLIDAL